MSVRSTNGSKPRALSAEPRRSANAISLREYEMKTFALELPRVTSEAPLVMCSSVAYPVVPSILICWEKGGETGRNGFRIDDFHQAVSCGYPSFVMMIVPEA